VMRALRAHDIGAGRVLARHEARVHGTDPVHWEAGATVEAPLSLYSCVVEPEWVDYNGHMTESAYLLAAGWASDKLFRYIGIDEAYRAGGQSYYTVETHIGFVGEASVDDPLDIATTVLGADAKRLHFVHDITHVAERRRLATVEQMLVHVDTAAGKSAPVPPTVGQAVQALAAAHAALEPPAPPTMGIR
jgi:acyl-CoA thioesterase FadM